MNNIVSTFERYRNLSKFVKANSINKLIKIENLKSFETEFYTQK